MSVKRPKRAEYESEPAYLTACLKYLDLRYPGVDGQRKRIVAFTRWSAETAKAETIAQHAAETRALDVPIGRAAFDPGDRSRMRRQIVELVTIDRPWTAHEADEIARLTAALRAALLRPSDTTRKAER
jgi:hypothetical protein